MRRASVVGGAALLMVATSAHIGSPDTWFAGTAGPYPVRIVVRSPGVIPGLADVIVKVTGPDVRVVTASPAYYNAGDRGVPPPDTARAVTGQPGTWTVPLWIMVSGSYSVRVHVTGGQGEGTAIVPVSAVATRITPLNPRLGWVLAGFGLMLFGGAVTIIGAAVRESVLVPGAEPDRRLRIRGRIAMGAAGVVLVLLLAGGKTWWTAVDRDYRRSLDRRWTASAEVGRQAGAPLLRFVITDSAWRGRNWNERPTPLIPDHGKLMHLFLVGEGDAGGFGHLHPISSDSATFEAPLPPLPAGRYQLFADLTHESGFARTLVASTNLPAPESTAVLDPDDSWFAGPISDTAGRLAGGARLVWEERRSSLVAGEDAGLLFVVREADGTIGVVEPYLGMSGHAVVVSVDRKVYIHLHPMGTVSSAAVLSLQERLPSDTIRGTLGRRLSSPAMVGPHGGPPAQMEGRIGFPYAFPAPGTYRIWVQFRRRGTIETVAFTARVR